MCTSPVGGVSSFSWWGCEVVPFRVERGPTSPVGLQGNWHNMTKVSGKTVHSPGQQVTDDWLVGRLFWPLAVNCPGTTQGRVSDTEISGVGHMLTALGVFHPREGVCHPIMGACHLSPIVYLNMRRYR